MIADADVFLGLSAGGVVKGEMVAKMAPRPLILAVDLPSGLNADTGAVDEGTLAADLTVTLAFAKTGMTLFPGAGYLGELVVGSIGLPDEMAIPAGLAVVALLATWRTMPRPQDLEPRGLSLEGRSLPRLFWWHAGACGLMAAGFVDFPLIAFHTRQAGLAGDASIPLLYALAMGVDAVAALLFGRLFDRYGLSVLLAGAACAAVASV